MAAGSELKSATTVTLPQAMGAALPALSSLDGCVPVAVCGPMTHAGLCVVMDRKLGMRRATTATVSHLMGAA